MIVLDILKIIGFVLAGIVALAILLILIVCLAPIKYQIAGKGDGADITAGAGAKWLFGLFKAAFEYKDKKAEYYVRIAGKNLISGSFGGKEDEEELLIVEEEAPAIDAETPEEAETEIEEPTKTESAAISVEERTETPEEKALENEQAATDIPENESAGIEDIESKENTTEESAEDQEAPASETKEEGEEEENRSLKNSLIHLKEKWDELSEKVERIRKFLEAKTTKRALKHIKVELFKILNHLKPRKLYGTVEFGMEDPATTAIIYGNTVTLAANLSRGQLALTPRFYEKGITFDVTIKGSIFIGYVVLCGIRLLLDRDLHKAIKFIRRFLNG